MKSLGLTVGLLVTVCAAGACAQEPAPQAILDKVEAAYAALQTYQTEGTSSMIMDHDGTKMVMYAEVSILLKKPNLYRVSWTTTMPSGPSAKLSGAAWNAGDQPYLYVSNLKVYSKMPSDLMALNMAAGLSFEGSRVVPALFFASARELSPFKQWTRLKREDDEQVDGADCYVVSGSSSISEKETVWVSRADNLIVKYSRSLAPPPEGISVPEISDEKLVESMKSMGQEVTEEKKAEMREKMKQMTAKVKDLKLAGVSRQNFFNSSTAALEAKDLQYVVPEGVVLNGTLPSKEQMINNLQQDDKAVVELSQAKTEEQRFYALGPAAKILFNQGETERAKQLARELQGLMPKYRKNWNYGNAVHDANIVLGRVAVSEGKIDNAKIYLIEAGRCPGSPQLNSFGPNMTLAKDLLEKGEKDAVLQYFELCGKFWEMGRDKLKLWTKDVADGKTPDFGANLVY